MRQLRKEVNMGKSGRERERKSKMKETHKRTEVDRDKETNIDRQTLIHKEERVGKTHTYYLYR